MYEFRFNKSKTRPKYYEILTTSAGTPHITTGKNCKLISTLKKSDYFHQGCVSLGLTNPIIYKCDWNITYYTTYKIKCYVYNAVSENVGYGDTMVISIRWIAISRFTYRQCRTYGSLMYGAEDSLGTFSSTNASGLNEIFIPGLLQFLWNVYKYRLIICLPTPKHWDHYKLTGAGLCVE